ncbi:hypothetical protein CNMCM8927_000320 [Aspergillus lentulus]|uniref:BZIP domain-containing protein n=1 Tax=Aspergillus lentulus TaxID=293939 RepID=A0AAN6BMX1_ASPLE|nr:hypothetical protein CNMCM8060_003233 [Aspergillus lentulus]KAF4182661.1 hypothetical protein CNMCM7927_009523 [Aspergillus lentulus]KAF4198742.1 hypothetical protein CNMCM8694_008092 [Aspergillus lentulus]KAF4202304.1 hypothetical protein CNMCM8927_000320 [Aspergillus lentulus]
MEDDFTSVVESLSGTPAPAIPLLTVSPADTSLNAPETKVQETKSEEKKPPKKRKSWGQELPIPKTNLPPRKRAKTEDEKEQRRIERVLRNRAAAQTSRERKRLEMEKLENEKIQMEQQNQFLLQRLSQMEAENNRLSQQLAQLTAEVRGSRSSTPKPGSPATASPTLTPTLFKQEGDELPLERIPFPTPSITDYSPTLKPSSLAESSDVTQHPAAVLCDLQCQLADSKDLEVPSRSLTSALAWNMTLQMTLQLLFLTMTSTAYSTVIHPLSQILRSLKTGSPLTFSTQEIYQHFHLILWLISTPSLSPSKASSRPTVFRMRLLTRLLACNPALARPLRDATGRALQLAVSENVSRGNWSAGDDAGRLHWESLLTLAWAIDRFERMKGRRRILFAKLERGARRDTLGNRQRSPRSSWSSKRLSETLTSLLMGKMVRKDPIFEARTNVKLHSNRLKKEAARAEATFKSEKAKADKAMKNREFQIARIHAASAVREKRRQVTLRAEAARADVIINELKAAQSTRDTSRTLALASRGLDAASKSVNLENLVSHANNFLARSEDFKIASSAIEDVAQGVSMQEYGAEGEAEVDRLMEQLADDAGVDMRLALDADAAPKEDVKEQKQADSELEDGLGARLRALRAAS